MLRSKSSTLGGFSRGRELRDYSPRPHRLQLERLESRCMLSASGVNVDQLLVEPSPLALMIGKDTDTRPVSATASRLTTIAAAKADDSYWRLADDLLELKSKLAAIGTSVGMRISDIANAIPHWARLDEAGRILTTLRM